MKGYPQCKGIDFTNTYSLVTKLTNIVFFSLAIKDWFIEQLDVGELGEEKCMWKYLLASRKRKPLRFAT